MLSELPTAVWLGKILEVIYSPVGTADVALSLGAWFACRLHVDAVLSLEVVAEVSVSIVVAVVTYDGDVFVVWSAYGWPELGAGEGDGGQGEEDQLAEEGKSGSAVSNSKINHINNFVGHFWKLLVYIL